MKIGKACSRLLKRGSLSTLLFLILIHNASAQLPGLPPLPKLPPPPIPWGLVPPNLVTQTAANDDLMNKCPSPDSAMKDELTKLLDLLMGEIQSVAGGKNIETSTAIIELSPSHPTDKFEVDYQKYFLDRLKEAAPGGTIADSKAKLLPLGFDYSVSLATNAIGAAPALVFHADDANIVTVGNPNVINNGLQVEVPLSLRSTSIAAGTTTHVQACATALPYSVEVAYTAKVQEGTKNCTNGEEGPLDVSVSPPSGSICINPVEVIVGPVLQPGPYAISSSGSHTATPCVGAYSWGPFSGTYNVSAGMTIQFIQADQCEALQNSCSNHGPCTGQCSLQLQNNHHFTVSGNWTSQCQGVTMYEQVTSTYNLQ